MILCFGQSIESVLQTRHWDACLVFQQSGIETRRLLQVQKQCIINKPLPIFIYYLPPFLISPVIWQAKCDRSWTGVSIQFLKMQTVSSLSLVRADQFTSCQILPFPLITPFILSQKLWVYNLSSLLLWDWNHRAEITGLIAFIVSTLMVRCCWFK